MKQFAVPVLVAALCASIVPMVSLADTPERATTVVDQRHLNLTVYNDGNALVHDTRSVALNTGVNRIAWRDVSANMDPSSAVLDSLDAFGHVSVLEQNFNYDVLNQDSLLRKYVGQQVIVVHPAQFAGERVRREPARILSLDNGIVLQYRDRIETSLQGYIEFPRIPKSLRDRPTLALDLQTDTAGRRNLDLRYLSSGFDWHVNYVGTLSDGESRMTLEGLVSLTNMSGTSYENARLQLVAGNLNAARPVALKTIARVSSRASSDIYNVNAQQENYFEYHLYTLAHPTTILDKQTKEVALLSAHDIPVKKVLELRGFPYYYQQPQAADLGTRIPVQVFVSFENRGGDLGIPLPAGVMRIYEDDSRGLPQYLGSDGIGHTPKNDTVRLHLGDAFDVIAKKKQTGFHLVTNCRATSSYEIDLLNAKDDAQHVSVIEPIPGDWSIIAESAPHEKSSASTATWLVDVPGSGKATLTYATDVSWCRD